MAGLLSKKRIVAGPRFNRGWNVAAALAINLSIGQAYAFSVFNLPLTHVLGVSEPLPEDRKLSAGASSLPSPTFSSASPPAWAASGRTAWARG